MPQCMTMNHYDYTLPVPSFKTRRLNRRRYSSRNLWSLSKIAKKEKTLHDTPEDLQPSQKVEVANHVFYLDTAFLK
jgi:hypothetical protein